MQSDLSETFVSTPQPPGLRKCRGEGAESIKEPEDGEEDWEMLSSARGLTVARSQHSGIGEGGAHKAPPQLRSYWWLMAAGGSGVRVDSLWVCVTSDSLPTLQ